MEKVCPLLEKLGIPHNEGYAGHSICQLCTLPKCIYEKPGPLSQADREELGRIAETLIKFKDEKR